MNKKITPAQKLRKFAGMWSDWSDKEIKDLKNTIKNMRKVAGKKRLKELGIIK